MRAAWSLIAVAALGVSFDALVTLPSEKRTPEARVAQTGPLATPAVNPGLGSEPPGGRLGTHPPGGRLGERVHPSSLPGGRDGMVPADPAGRIGPIDAGHVGAPPAGAVPNPPIGAVPPPAAGAVQPPPGPNVRPVGPTR